MELEKKSFRKTFITFCLAVFEWKIVHKYLFVCDLQPRSFERFFLRLGIRQESRGPRESSRSNRASGIFLLDHIVSKRIYPRRFLPFCTYIYIDLKLFGFELLNRQGTRKNLTNFYLPFLCLSWNSNKS